jgi:hypothetical protein
MNLPNRELAVVTEEKIVDYLLSTTHPHGRHKAAFFSQFGFTRRRWKDFAAALVHHAATHPVAKLEASQFGIRYIVDGIMQMADGHVALVRTVWFIETGSDVPRLVTAYPLRG